MYFHISIDIDLWKIKCMYGKGGYLSVDIIFNLHNWLVV